MTRIPGILLITTALAAPAVMTAPAVASAPQISATVPNLFQRNCSYISGRCTAYRQTNPPYNPRVPSVYSTKWVWYWI